MTVSANSRSKGRTVLAVKQQLRRRDADAGRSRPAGGSISSSGALQQPAPLQGHAVVRGPEVGRPGVGVGVGPVAQGQTLVAWRGGRRSSVTLVLGGRGDTVD